MINEPSKLNIFPNYLVGNLKSVYLINNEKFIGEGIGILIGEDIILTSAHNLIFSQLINGNIVNYKPQSISFHLLSNGYLELLEPINCEVDSIIYSDYFKNFKFIENYSNNDSQISKIKYLNLRKNTDVEKNDENIRKQSNTKDNNNILNSNHNDFKSRSSDYTISNKKRSLSKKLNISNISEIPLQEDYSIIFTEISLGSQIKNLFCEKDAKLYNEFEYIDEKSKIFKVFENHVNLIHDLENTDTNKFQNSKISMISSIKYNSNLLGVPQYVYGSHFNDLNNKISKNKKRINISNNEENKKECKIFFTENRYKYNSPISSYNYFTDEYNLNNSLISNNNLKWEKELKHCLFINYDKNFNKKLIRNSHLDNLKKLMNFNCEEFYSDGKLVQCEAKGKLCSLLYEKLRKSTFKFATNNFNNPRYEGNNESATPYFNRHNNENEKKLNNDDSINFFKENKEHLSFYDLNNDLVDKSISIINDLSCPDILDEKDSFDNNPNIDKIYNKIFRQKIQEIMKYSFSEKNDLELKNKDNIDKTKSDQEIKNFRKDVFLDEFINKKLHSYNNKFNSYQLIDNYCHNRSILSNLEKIDITFSSNKIENKDIKHENLDMNIDLNKCELNYMITTYKGQSGSPLFIRIKNQRLIEMNREDLINCQNNKYSFIFIGLHSRSPEYFEPINKTKYQNFLSKNNLSNSNSILSENLSKEYDNQNKQKTINININLNEEIRDLNININLNSLIEKHGAKIINNQLDSSAFSNNKINEFIFKKDMLIKEFLKKNNYCSYNVGLKIDKEIFKNIKKLISKSRATRKEKETNTVQEGLTMTSCDASKSFYINEKSKISNNEPNYMLVNIHIYDEYIVKGAFNITSNMNILFEIASEYLEVDKKYFYINIDDKYYNSDQCGNEFILKYFEKKFNRIEANHNNECNGRIFRNIINANFVINIDKYSDSISEKLFSKLKDNIKNFDNNKDYDNSEKSDLRIIIKYIFNEIQTFFEKSQTLYGLLFNAIKKKMIKLPN